MHLSIILPTYNEKKNIFILINLLKKKIPHSIKKEIIVVDDNSEDKTYYLLKKKFNNNKIVKLILRKKDKSLGKSVGKGVSIAKGKLILVMDVDLSHNPSDIVKLISFTKNYDLVSCSRYLDLGNMENKIHFYLSYFYNIFLRLFLGTKVYDNTGGFFCIKRKVLRKLPQKKIFFGYGDYFFRLLFFLKNSGGSIIEIPTIYKSRVYGKSKSKFLTMAIKYFLSALKLKLNLN